LAVGSTSEPRESAMVQSKRAPVTCVTPPPAKSWIT
jgi:hypothetical protein